ncbi:hypothetical protein [Roseateles asaccharophilus]|uniref:hypothetical protein n=1 Tax=Roseateles asaccharophilus TaxID=582607 RepID=UPI00384ECE2D
MNMLTAEGLLAIAVEADAEYQRLLALHPPGTFNAERNDAREKAEQALICAQWMEKQGATTLAFVGPLGDAPFKRGDLVRVRKGAIMRSTNPKVPRQGQAYMGTRPIKIHGIDRGYLRDREEVVQPRINWAGTGGYWCWVEANDVELTK